MPHPLHVVPPQYRVQRWQVVEDQLPKPHLRQLLHLRERHRHANPPWRRPHHEPLLPQVHLHLNLAHPSHVLRVAPRHPLLIAWTAYLHLRRNVAPHPSHCHSADGLTPAFPSATN